MNCPYNPDFVCPYPLEDDPDFVCPYLLEDDPDVCCSCFHEEAYK